MLNVVVVCDILIRGIVLGFDKYKNKLFIFLDIITLVFSLIAIAFSVLLQSDLTIIETFSDEILFIAICIAQYLRIVSFLKMQRDLYVFLVVF